MLPSRLRFFLASATSAIDIAVVELAVVSGAGGVEAATGRRYPAVAESAVEPLDGGSLCITKQWAITESP